MQVTHAGIDTQKGPADWFTGDVYIDAIAAPAGTSTFAAANVQLTPGARTAWHTHPHGQTIYVTEGVGRCQREGGPVEVIRAGDPDDDEVSALRTACRGCALGRGGVRA